MSKTERENQSLKKMTENHKTAILYRLYLAKQELQKIIYTLNDILPSGTENIYKTVDQAWDILNKAEDATRNYNLASMDALSAMDKASDDLEKLYEEQIEKDKRARKFVREE